MINGLKAVACLEKSEEICRATQSNSILLVPLMENSFHYCLMSFPLKDFLTKIELYELYEKLVRISKDFDIHIISLVGDGDSRLRALQYRNYTFFSSKTNFLTKTEFPIHLGFGRANDIPVQDVLHGIKKLRNQAKYLSTKALIMCSTDTDFNIDNRLKYAIRWDIIYIAWNQCKEFKDCVTKSAVSLSCKQDPSLVAELSFTYSLMYEMGFLAVGLYLECINLVLLSYYDRSMHPYTDY